MKCIWRETELAKYSICKKKYYATAKIGWEIHRVSTGRESEEEIPAKVNWRTILLLAEEKEFDMCYCYHWYSNWFLMHCLDILAYFCVCMCLTFWKSRKDTKAHPLLLLFTITHYFVRFRRQRIYMENEKNSSAIVTEIKPYLFISVKSVPFVAKSSVLAFIFVYSLLLNAINWKATLEFTLALFTEAPSTFVCNPVRKSSVHA